MNPQTGTSANRTEPDHRWPLSLFTKLALTFLLILTLLAIIYSYLTAYSANRYFEATYQRLNQDVAAHIAKFARPFINQQVNRRGADEIFFNAMVTNPSAEVYLLDSTGRILLYHAPISKIKRQRVSLEPVRQFIQTHGQAFVKGDDPRNASEQKIFSAAEVIRDGRQQGYVYVILGSEEYGSAMALLRQDYVLQWGLKTMIITLLAALTVGLLAFYFQTRNLRAVVQTVKKFSEGDFSARIQVGESSEVAQVAATFNAMADRLTSTIANLRLSEQVRRDLVANISHDLRTPITAIRGYAETLALTATLNDTQTKQYVSIILQSTNTLMKRVNELFELSKLDTKEASLQREPFILADLVTEVFSKFQLLVQSKHIAFECINCDLTTPCYADISLMERVIQNLVENAVSYTPESGFIQLELENKGQLISVSVLNSMPELSEPVWAYMTGSASARPPNVGLGLLIVRKILSLHQTELSVERLTDDTVCFSFTLPVYIVPV
jgi:signal transduction histidine kinase